MSSSIIVLLAICLTPKATARFADLIAATATFLAQNRLSRWECNIPAMSRQNLGRLRSGGGWACVPAEQRMLDRSLKLTIRLMALHHQHPRAALLGFRAAISLEQRLES